MRLNPFELIPAFLDFLADLGRGDPVALALAGFFGLLIAAVAAVWIYDLLRRQRESKKARRPARKPKATRSRPGW